MSSSLLIYALFGLLSQTPAMSPGPVAIVPVGSETETPSASIATMLAEAMRQHTAVLEHSEVYGRMQNFLMPDKQDIDTVREQFTKSDEAYAAFDIAQSVHILEQIVHTLEIDGYPTQAKLALLQRARVQLADRLLGLAGKGESGRGETVLGQKALHSLEAALCAEPLLALPAGVYPPKVRRLMEIARQNVRAMPTGSLEVTSSPPGAMVFLEGRELGAAPVSLESSIPYGRYRLWVEKDGHRARTRTVNIGAGQAKVKIDLAFEGAIDVEHGGLRPIEGTLLTDEICLQIGQVLDVDNVVITGTTEYQGSRWIYAAIYSVNSSRALRRGAVRIETDSNQDLVPANTFAKLATFLNSGESDESIVQQQPVPIAIETATNSPSHFVEDQEQKSLPWGGIAAVTGGALLLAASAGAAVAFYLYWEANPTQIRRVQIEVQK